jgi:hypothetical protein
MCWSRTTVVIRPFRSLRGSERNGDFATTDRRADRFGLICSCHGRTCHRDTNCSARGLALADGGFDYCASVRSAVAFDAVQLGQAQVRLSISHLFTVRHSRRSPVLWLRDVDCDNFVALPRMGILAWPIHFHRKLPPRCHAVPATLGGSLRCSGLLEPWESRQMILCRLNFC